MAETTFEDELSRAEAALDRIRRALDERPDREQALRREMTAVLADLDALIAAADTPR
ncbi:hypothetical protein WJT74_03470 [Sphingomicrobium sp. XHP0239]|uniref:hypothetical protein n=1 Tax=Sphingomicrobium maritimum TaxID=3133972 RepID=UPI0031CCD43A